MSKFLLIDDIIEGDVVGVANPRKSKDPRRVRELALDIVRRGLLHPFRVWKTTHEGKTVYVRVAGARRMAAIKLNIKEGTLKEPLEGLKKTDAGWEVAVQYVPWGEAKEVFVDAFVDNLHHERLTSFEEASGAFELKTKYGYAQKEIAEKISKSEAWVSKNITAYEKATRETRDAWRTSKITAENVMKLIKESDDDIDQNKKLAKVVEKRATGKRADIGEARAGQNDKKKERVSRPQTKHLERIIATATDAPKKARYVQGVKDGIEFALGRIGYGDFDQEYHKHVTLLGAKPGEDDEADEATA